MIHRNGRLAKCKPPLTKGLCAPHLPFFPADLLWLAALVAYDASTMRRIHPATWLGFALLAAWFLWVMPWIASNAALQAALKAYLGIAG